MMHSARGFTLIELLVVMSIIATLLSIAAPRYFGSVDHSREVTLRQSLLIMRDAIDKFKADSGQYPESLAALVDGKYLREVPVDPLTESSTTWRVVPPSDGRSTGVFDVKSGATGRAQNGSEFKDW